MDPSCLPRPEAGVMTCSLKRRWVAPSLPHAAMVLRTTAPAQTASSLTLMSS